MASNNSVSFHIAIEGDSTNDSFRGTFKVKERLSHRDELERDKIRRRLLGDDGVNAAPRALNQAFILAELAVRVIEAPPWWTGAGDGLDLYDDNVIAEVYKEALKVESDALEALRKKGQELEKELRKTE